MRFVGIDPATNTGFVALDPDGNLLRAKELTGSGQTTPTKVRTLHDEVLRHLRTEDKVCIEGFALEAQDTNKTSSGYNWAARLAVDRVIGEFISPTPGQLKKFVNVSEWIGEPGSKKRLPGKEVKKLVIAAVYDHWGYKASTDNIADAYVLARIREAIWRVKNGQVLLQGYPVYQQEVILSLINPVINKKKPAIKKAKSRKNAPAAGKRGPKTEQECLF